MGSAADHVSSPEAFGRYIALDEQGNALRATWRPAHGFVNLSIWRDDVCIETFHLSPKDASDLVSFLVAAFAASVPPASRPALRAVPSPETTSSSSAVRTRIDSTARDLRRRLSGVLDRLARRLRP